MDGAQRLVWNNRLRKGKPINRFEKEKNEIYEKATQQPLNTPETWRRILPQLVAVFLLVVFLASEYSALITEY